MLRKKLPDIFYFYIVCLPQEGIQAFKQTDTYRKDFESSLLVACSQPGRMVSLRNRWLFFALR